METALDDDLQHRLLHAQLPTLPAVAVQLIGLGSSTSAHVQQLVEIVANDPAVSASLVRLANSAAYRRVKPADSIALAVSYLGFERSRTVALSATLLPALVCSQQPAFCYLAFWRRSLIAGACARAIGQRLFPADIESLFLAALLQDIGLLALAQLPLAIYQGLDCEDYSHERMIHNERRAIREDHAAVGAWLLERWDLPAKLVQAVRFSNNPALARAASDHADFNSAVIAAGFMADAWMRSGSEPDLNVLRAQTVKLLGLKWQDVLKLFTGAAAEISLVEALCGVRVTDPGSVQQVLDILHDAPVALAEGSAG